MKLNLTPYIHILFFLVGLTNSFAQEIELKINAKDSTNISILESIKFKHFHKNKESIHQETDSISKQLYQFGFINNYIDNFDKKDTVYTANYILGFNPEKIIITYNAQKISKKILTNFSSKVTDNDFKININEIPLVLNQIANILENNGNSFAKVSLKNIQHTKNGLFANLHINKTTKRKIDGIIVKGYSNFPKSFTKHYLNLKKETVFNIDKLKFASNTVKSLPFVSEIKPPEVLFTKDSTVVYLYLKKNRSNKFDGLIGFSSDKTGKLNFNGYLDLLLNNIFDKGENLTLNWKSNGDDRKLFNLSIETPYIFNSPITPKTTFNIHKQDSTFLNIRALIDVSFAINSQNNVSAKFQTEKSNDLTVNQNDIREFNNTFYGFSYGFKKNNLYDTLQDKFSIIFNALWGNRTINGISKKEQQQKYELQVSYNWMLNQKNSIYIKNFNGLFISDEYFTNEIYRLGGSNSIRGFNEESIFSTSFSALNFEYRYYLANQSFLYSITDFAYIQNEVQNSNSQLYSFGVGYRYNIKSGLVDISYALGKTSKLPFDFNNSKFHIKLIQYF